MPSTGSRWRGLGQDIDAILPLSIPAYPTEVWNSNPEPLAERGVPVVFWCLPEHDEPDFWRWSARDMLSSLGIDIHLVENRRHGLALLRSLALRRQLQGASLVVFGVQNFPWNAHAAGTIESPGSTRTRKSDPEGAGKGSRGALPARFGDASGFGARAAGYGFRIVAERARRRAQANPP